MTIEEIIDRVARMLFAKRYVYAVSGYTAAYYIGDYKYGITPTTITFDTQEQCAEDFFKYFNVISMTKPNNSTIKVKIEDDDEWSHMILLNVRNNNIRRAEFCPNPESGAIKTYSETTLAEYAVLDYGYDGSDITSLCTLLSLIPYFNQNPDMLSIVLYDAYARFKVNLYEQIYPCKFDCIMEDFNLFYNNIIQC